MIKGWINNGEYYINDKRFNKPSTSKIVYTIYLKDASKFRLLNMYRSSPHSKNYSMFSLSKNEYNYIKKMGLADSIFTLPVDSNQIQVGVIASANFKYRNIYFYAL